MKPNPRYRDAIYELVLIEQDGAVRHLPMPFRFDIHPPLDIWLDMAKFNVWRKEHSIDPYIEE